MLKISKKLIAFVLVLVIIASSIVGYFVYQEMTRVYKSFFLKGSFYSSNYGNDKISWDSYDFQPVTQSIVENSDGVILNVKYRSSDGGKWLTAKILLWGKNNYQDIHNVKVFNTIEDGFQPFKPADITINTLDRAKKMIPLNKQIMVTIYQQFPNSDLRTEESCKTAKDFSAGMDLCKISDTIDKYSPNQIYFWDTEDIRGEYLIPNFVVLTPLNDEQ